MKEDKIEKIGSVAARRKSCGYHIMLTCAACVHCQRSFHAKGHAAQMFSADCSLHDFDVNIDRGFCKDFEKCK